MSAEWSGIVIALAVFIMGLLAHVFTTIWWASRITTILSILQSAVDEIRADKKTYSTKEDLAREIAIADREHKAIWKNIDEIKQIINHNGIGGSS